MTFHVGQKVVCVDDSMRVSYHRAGWFSRFRRWEKLGHNLNRGDVYTVNGTITYSDARTGAEVFCLYVAEAHHFGNPHIAFPACQFRHVAEHKTDISIFTKLLTPSPKQKVHA